MAYDPAPGTKQPQKYPKTGPNYQRYGEQPGYVYFYPTDSYYLDKKAVKSTLDAQGQGTETPSLSKQLTPMLAATAGGALALEAGKGLYSNAKSAISDIYTGAKGLLGLNGTSDLKSLPTSSYQGLGLLSNDEAATSILAGNTPQFGIGGYTGPADYNLTSGSETAAASPGGEGSGDLLARGGQGLAGAAQVYQGYEDLKDKNYAGAGINTTAGATNLAVAGGADVAGTMGSNFIPGVNALAGGYEGYQTAKAIGSMPAGARRTRTGVMGGAAAGAGVGAAAGTLIGGPGLGTGIGAGIGAGVGMIAGGIGALTGSSKGGGQQLRDSIRQNMQEGGMIDDQYKGTLADGTIFDWGNMGGGGMSKKGMDHKLIGESTAYADALGAGMGLTGGDVRESSLLFRLGGIANTKDDPTVVQDNFKHFAEQLGMTRETAIANYDQQLADEDITKEKYDTYVSLANQIMPSGQTEEAAAGTDAGTQKRWRESQGSAGYNQGGIIGGNITQKERRKALLGV